MAAFAPVTLDDATRQEAVRAGFDPGALGQALGVVAGAVGSGRIPGAVVILGRGEGTLLGPFTFGMRALLPQPEPMTADTIFDMASLTKVLATAAVAMALVDRGALRLGAPVAEYLPEWAECGEHRAQVRIFHLLTHTSGLPAWRALYEGCEDGPQQQRRQRCRALMERRLLETPLEAPPGERVVYSCLGYILLGLVLERLGGEPLDGMARRLIFDPLGMETARFAPPAEEASRCAATEYCARRRRIVRGEVHDENAYFFGGVAGNAGLFASAWDVARFASMMLGKGTLESCRVLSPAGVEAMTANRTPGLNEARGLGWAIKGSSLDSSAGDLLSAAAYGHTGFTGTSLWIDPVRSLYCVLLTNRVHPSRLNEAHLALRPAFHNAVAASLRA